jgi:glycosyltransferase involved in cell wall biosynthesis
LAIQVKDQLNTSNVYLSQSSQCSNINQTRIQYGRKHFSQSRVIICGLIRDREPHIQRLKEQLNSIAKFFGDYAIVIVENDSKDGTRRELINWANNDGHVHVIGCDNQTNNIHSCNLSLPATVQQYIPKISRIEKMVRLRNIYMNYVENHSLLKQFDYIIVEDFDLTTTTYLNGFFSTGFYLNNDLTIDAICSNGMFYNKILSNMITYTSYFDPYAHKDEENQNWGMAYNDVWSTLFRKYSCDDDLVSVQSCFSGRTIYRSKSIQGKRYRTYLDQNQQAICEHVGLHETINKMYLNSEMILYITKNNINK